MNPVGWVVLCADGKPHEVIPPAPAKAAPVVTWPEAGTGAR